MSLVSQLGSLVTRLATEFNTLRSELSSAVASKADSSNPAISGTITLTSTNAAIEITGTSNAFIDFKNNAGDDYDARLINASGAKGITIEAASMTTGRTLRNTTLSTSNPSGGSDGDVWLKYTA